MNGSNAVYEMPDDFTTYSVVREYRILDTFVILFRRRQGDNVVWDSRSRKVCEFTKYTAALGYARTLFVDIVRSDLSSILRKLKGAVEIMGLDESLILLTEDNLRCEAIDAEKFRVYPVSRKRAA